jgi:hypothetical protein
VHEQYNVREADTVKLACDKIRVEGKSIDAFILGVVMLNDGQCREKVDALIEEYRTITEKYVSHKLYVPWREGNISNAPHDELNEFLRLRFLTKLTKNSYEDALNDVGGREVFEYLTAKGLATKPILFYTTQDKDPMMHSIKHRYPNVGVAGMPCEKAVLLDWLHRKVPTPIAR